MAYTFNYTTIGTGMDKDYIDQMKETLMAHMLFEGRTAEFAKVIPGVKNRISLNLLANTAVPTDATCGWTPAPSNQYVTLDQKELKVNPLEVKDALCPKDFEQLYLGMYMKGNKEVPFAQLIADSYVNVVMNANEKYIWDGNGTFTGLLTDINGDASVIDASTDVTTATTAMQAVEIMLKNATPDILSHNNKVLYCGYAFYNKYASELRAANWYIQANGEYKNGTLANYEMIIPGTDVKLVAMAGMDNLVNTTLIGGYNIGTISTPIYTPLVLTYTDNIVIGTDMMNDEEMFDMWYSRDNDEVRVNIQYKLGWSFYFGDHIVKGYKC